MLSRQQINKLLDITITLFAVVVGFEILLYHSVVSDAINSFVLRIGVGGWIAIGIIQFLQVIFIPIPATFIKLASMSMYPNDKITLFIVTMIAVISGTLVNYLIGRKWGKKAVKWAAGTDEDYEKWNTALKSNKTKLFYLGTVLLPIFPDDILCMVAGSIRMNIWFFLACNIIGRAIGLITFMFVFGSTGKSLLSIILFGGVLIALIIWKIINKRKMNYEFNNYRE